MAKLLLINAKSQSSRDNREIGDIVDIYPDDYAFSNSELAQFDVVAVTGDAATLKAALTPERGIMFRATTTEWTMDMPEEKRVWRDPTDGVWKDIGTMPRFILRYENGFIKECISRHPENMTPAMNENYTAVEK